MVQDMKNTVITPIRILIGTTKGRFREPKKFHLYVSIYADRIIRSMMPRNTSLNSMNLREDAIRLSLRLKYFTGSSTAYTIVASMYATNIMTNGNMAKPMTMPAGPPIG